MIEYNFPFVFVLCCVKSASVKYVDN